MKICHILWSFTTGGIETMLVDIINEQARDNRVMLVVVNDLVDNALVQKLNPDCRVRLLRRRAGSRNPLPILRLNAIVARFGPDIIHHHSPRTSRLLFTRRPMVRTIHATDLAADEYGRMAALYSISRSVSDYTAAQGFSSEIIINGIPMSGIPTRTDRKLSAADGRFHIVQVGRVLFQQKGQDIAVEAMARLVHKCGLRNPVLHIIGQGEDTQALEALVRSRGLENNVVIEGLRPRSEVLASLCRFDLFIQPSRQEGFGLTVAEACAAGLPVLVSDLPGPLEIIDGGRLGATFRSGSPADLAEKIQSIYHGGYDSTLIAEARERVARNYDVAVTARRYLDAYRKIVKSANNA